MKNRKNAVRAMDAEFADPGADKQLDATQAKYVKRGAKRITEEDVAKVIDKAEDIKKKFDPKGPLGRFIEDGKLLISIVKDYWTGKYRHIPYMAIAAIVFTLLYVLNPWDLVFDFLPVVGQLDDAAIVTMCLMLVEKELHTYKAWKGEPAA